MFFFVAVPVIGGILSKVLGRKLGALVTAGGAGAAAWIFSASLLIAGVAALLTMLVVGVLGVGALQRGMGRGRGAAVRSSGAAVVAAWRRRGLRWRWRRLRFGRRRRFRRRRRVGRLVR